MRLMAGAWVLTIVAANYLTQAAEPSDFSVAKPLQYQNLVVFPVLSAMPKMEDRYIILEEGLKSNDISVYEVGAGPTAQPPQPNTASRQHNRRTNNANNNNAAQADDTSADVNHLMVINRTKKPLYLMPGEIIYGGQQDRCVAQEYIIAADGKPVKIEVFCVEHGRWANRENAERGKFSGKAGNLNASGRLAVQSGKSQGEVWDEVGSANAASGARPSTGAFTANYTDPMILKKIEPYVKELEKPVAEQRQVVGAIVAINGKFFALDVFNSTPLFQKMWPKLLKGYSLDATIADSNKTTSKRKKADKQKPATWKDAEEFFAAAMKSEVKEHKNNGAGGLVVTKRETEKVISYSAGMGGGGEAVHSSGYAK